MNIFKDDLFKNKYFIAIFMFLFIIIGLVWLIDYQSVESRCARHVEGIGSNLGMAGGNRLMDMQMQIVLDSSIKDCIERGGP